MGTSKRSTNPTTLSRKVNLCQLATRFLSVCSEVEVGNEIKSAQSAKDIYSQFACKSDENTSFNVSNKHFNIFCICRRNVFSVICQKEAASFSVSYNLKNLSAIKKWRTDSFLGNKVGYLFINLTKVSSFIPLMFDHSRDFAEPKLLFMGFIMPINASSVHFGGGVILRGILYRYFNEDKGNTMSPFTVWKLSRIGSSGRKVTDTFKVSLIQKPAFYSAPILFSLSFPTLIQ